MKTHGKLKWYYQTWFIVLLFAAWPIFIPPLIGIFLLIKQYSYLKESSNIMETYGDFENLKSKAKKEYDDYVSDLNNSKSELEADYENLKSESQSEYDDYISDLENSKGKASEKIEELKKQVEELKAEKKTLTNDIFIAHYDFSSYDGITSQECKNKLALLKNATKDLIKNNKYIDVPLDNKDIRANAKQIIRLFNAECDNIIINLTVGRIDAARSKVTKSFESINKVFEVDNIQLNEAILKNKLEELNLVYTYYLKAEQEKSIQKAIKEQMIEEEKARRELEAAKRKVEKDEQQFENEMKRLMAYLQKTESEVEKKLYIDKINDLEEKLKELQEKKKDVEARVANATAGYVYIISNIGSFGEDVYKIGMTRRLEPMDRIKELSSASVPFEFDVHAMIFSENAPELENTLHEKFRNNSVNKVNYRKEFFKVSLQEIEDVVKKEFNNTTEFTIVPVASEYRETKRINEMAS